MEGLSVLIADDEVLTRLNVREHLLGEGYKVCAETGNGLEILELAKEKKPDIALLDIQMPGLDGINAAKQLRMIGIPTVLMTAYIKPGFISRAEKVGVYGYLNKPIKLQDLVPTLIIAYGRWNEVVLLSNEIDQYKKKFENQKRIEIAKGIYAISHGITEYEANKKIQKISMDSCKPIVQVCNEIIKNHIAFKD